MALVPLIQPPIMRALTTKEERSPVMTQLRQVSQTEKIIFPVAVTVIVSLLLPEDCTSHWHAYAGNLFRGECGVVDRLSKTAQNEPYEYSCDFPCSVGRCLTMSAETFLTVDTIKIICLGVVAFAGGTAGGVLWRADVLCCRWEGQSLIGSTQGFQQCPWLRGVSQKVGAEENPDNFLLLLVMGPNVAGVIGRQLLAGVMLSLLL